MVPAPRHSYVTHCSGDASWPDLEGCNGHAAECVTQDKDGKDVMVKVTKDTRVKAKSAIKVEAIKPGTRIVVTAIEEKDKSMTAKSIEVGVEPAAAR